jgi:hypothetical protein
MGRTINAYKICRKTHRKEIILKSLGVDERMILKWMLKIKNGWIWPGFMWFRIGTSDGL